MCISCVMLVGRRKSAYRYVMIGVCWSVDHYGLLVREKWKAAVGLLFRCLTQVMISHIKKKAW